MPKRVLLVDDDMHFSNFLVLLLKKLNIVVDTADHGEDALIKLTDFKYDLVISDINMPKLDGIDLYHSAVKKYPYLTDKFILITGAIEPEFNIPALKDKIIEKSCIEKIIQRVKLLIGGS